MRSGSARPRGRRPARRTLRVRVAGRIDVVRAEVAARRAGEVQIEKALKHIDVQKPKQVIGRTTVGSMESGLFYGYVGLVEGLVQRIRGELGSSAVCVATGGLADVIAPETSSTKGPDTVSRNSPRLAV